MSVIGQPYEDDMDDLMWRAADLLVENTHLKRQLRDRAIDARHYRDEVHRLRSKEASRG